MTLLVTAVALITGLCILTRVVFVFSVWHDYGGYYKNTHPLRRLKIKGLWLCLYQRTGRLGRPARQLLVSTVWIHQASVQKGSQGFRNDQGGQEDKIDALDSILSTRAAVL
jgi:hypothetical protein